MTHEEMELVEKLKQIDLERGLHLIQRALAHYSQEYDAERNRFTMKPRKSVFAIIHVWPDRELYLEQGPKVPGFDVLAIPDPDIYAIKYNTDNTEDIHQANAVDLADSGYCRQCNLAMEGSKYSTCPICGNELFLT